jgi:hypothetical protein
VLILRQWKAGASRDAAEKIESVAEAVAPDFKPVLRPARVLQAEALHVRTGVSASVPSETAERYRSSDETVAAEIYSNGVEVVLLRFDLPGIRFRVGRRGEIVPEGDPELVCHCFGISDGIESVAVDGFVVKAGAALGLTLEKTAYKSSHFDELAAEPGRATTRPRRNQIDGARVLSDRRTRTLAQAVKTAGGLLIGDLGKQLPGASPDEIETLRTRLEHSGLIGSETVVVCKKTQVQVARAPSNTEIMTMAASGVKCGCGRKIDEERIEAALAVTDLGRELLDSSRWFSVVLHEELLRVGVDESRILLEHQQGGDEMDVLAEISGEIVFFELKDKEFSLGNAYSFGAKLGIIRPEHSVIVASDGVGNDAKDHFQRAGLSVASEGRSSITGVVEERPPQVRYIENLDALSAELDEIASSIYAADANREIGRILPRAMLDAEILTNDLVERYAPTKTAPPQPARRTTRRSTKRSA